MPRKIDGFGNATDLKISIDEMQTQVTRYKTERYDKYVPTLQVDSRGVWVSKDKILELFERNPKASGIRMYYGVLNTAYYDDGCHNLIFVSTTQNASNDNEDQMGDDDWVLIAENSEAAESMQTNMVICPPPNRPCQGSRLSY